MCLGWFGVPLQVLLFNPPTGSRKFLFFLISNGPCWITQPSKLCKSIRVLAQYLLSELQLSSRGKQENMHWMTLVLLRQVAMHLSPSNTDMSNNVCSFLEMTSGDGRHKSAQLWLWSSSFTFLVSNSGAHLSQNGVASALPCSYHEKPHLKATVRLSRWRQSLCSVRFVGEVTTVPRLPDSPHYSRYPASFLAAQHSQGEFDIALICLAST
jgi:hypothetical protein